MRTFYIFKINNEFKILTKNRSYNLYKTIENIYNLREEDYGLGITMFEQIAEVIDSKQANLKIFDINRHNDTYTKFSNIHMINNYYNDEVSKLIINKSHLILKSSKEFPTFLKELNFDNNLFACDFQNKDYFWIEELKCLTC